MSFTSIVLAGGKSARLGRDKSREVLGGKSLINRVISRLITFSHEIVVVTSQGQTLPSLSQHPNLKTVEDLYPRGGSLGGIYTGLLTSSSSHSLVVACDMPFLNIALLRYLLDISPPFDVIIPRIDGKEEPLHAVYSKDCIGPIRGLLERGGHKILDFFNEVRMRYVEEAELARFDPEHLSFFNINTQADLDRARELIASREPASSLAENKGRSSS